jgi:hypothetical protein
LLLLFILLPPMQVQVLYYDASGSSVETGKHSPSNSSLQEGCASWASDLLAAPLNTLLSAVQSRATRAGSSAVL